MTPEQLHILQHSLGRDKYGQAKSGESPHLFDSYRNRYICNPNEDLTTLVSLGYMQDNGQLEACGNMHFYSVTRVGFEAMIQASPKAPKITRAQRRYREYLSADCGHSFGEYIKWRTANNERLMALGYPKW